MKRIIAVALLAIAVPAMGQTITSGSASGSESNATSNSGAVSGSRSNQDQGQAQGQQANNANTVSPSQSVTINGTPIPTKTETTLRTEGTQTIRSTPSLNAPALPSVINNDMCVTSATAGASGIGFGIGIGLQFTDVDCVRRINARQLYNMGYGKAAIALMAQDGAIARALADAGFSALGEPLPAKQPEKMVNENRKETPAGVKSLITSDATDTNDANVVTIPLASNQYPLREVVVTR